MRRLFNVSLFVAMTTIVALVSDAVSAKGPVVAPKKEVKPTAPSTGAASIQHAISRGDGRRVNDFTTVVHGPINRTIPVVPKGTGTAVMNWSNGSDRWGSNGWRWGKIVVPPTTSGSNPGSGSGGSGSGSGGGGSGGRRAAVTVGSGNPLVQPIKPTSNGGGNIRVTSPVGSNSGIVHGTLKLKPADTGAINIWGLRFGTFEGGYAGATTAGASNAGINGVGQQRGGTGGTGTGGTGTGGSGTGGTGTGGSGGSGSGGGGGSSAGSPN
jgi:hypothetical protein